MTPEEFLEKMKNIKEEFNDDTEVRHALMDDLMVECFNSIGYSKGAKVFSDSGRWYG